jgi:hypothetical protein
VVDVGGEPTLTSRALSQPAAGGAAALGLQPSPDATVTATQTVQPASGGAVAIRVGCDVHHPEIDPEPAVRLMGVGGFDLDRDVEYPAAVGQRSQFAFADPLRPLEQRSLALATSACAAPGSSFTGATKHTFPTTSGPAGRQTSPLRFAR